jgi:hypothetical protein
VESTKSEPDIGRYLHPEVWGQAAEGIRSWADEARRQAIEMMPEPLRERWEALLTSYSVDQDELQQLIDEAGRFPDRPERPSWARLEQDWRVMQEVARGMGIATRQAKAVVDRGGGDAGRSRGLRAGSCRERRARSRGKEHLPLSICASIFKGAKGTLSTGPLRGVLKHV